MSTRRLVIVFCGPRAGSNLLVDLLGGLPGTLALSEVFNPAGVYGLNLHPQLEARLQKDAGGAAALHRLFRRAPERAVALLDARVPVAATVIVKLLPHQVPARAVAGILARHGRCALFLTRRRIDQYASLLKARESGVWFGPDASEGRPEGDAERFLGWAGMLDGWLGDMAAACDRAAVPRAQMIYEQDLATADAATRAERVAAGLAAVGLDVAAQDMPVDTFFDRQDRHRSGFDKLENGAAVARDLQALDLRDYALSVQDLPVS